MIFLNKPITKTKAPRDTFSKIDGRVEAGGKLRHHLFVMHDRSSDELGEEGDEEGVIEDVVFFGFAAVAVDQIGDLLEREEADPERPTPPR